MAHNIRNQPTIFESFTNLKKVIEPRPKSQVPKEVNEEIQNFIKSWGDDEGLNEVQREAKNYTEPRGIAVKYLKVILNEFLADTSLRLFKLKKKFKNYPKGKVFEATGQESARNLIDVQTIERNELIRMKKDLLLEIDRTEWTVADVVFHKLSREYKEISGASFYERIRIDTNDSNILGPLFSGIFVISSRKSNFSDLLTTVIKKAEEDGEDYVYFDFFAKNHAHREAYQLRTEEGIEVRETFIKQICPKLVPSFDRVYLFIDDWKNPSIFTRGWCMYEMFWSFENHMHVDIIYPNKVLTTFEKSITTEFKNDYVSYHDTASTFFTVFEHFSFSMLRNGSKTDNSIITSAFEEIEAERDVNNGVRDVVSSNLFELLARIVVSVGNEKLDDLMRAINNKDYKTLDVVVSILRKCAFYLRRADYNELAIAFYRRCRKALDILPRETLEQVYNRSKSIMRLKFDVCKCHARQSLASLRANQEKSRQDSLRLAIIRHKEGVLHANLAIASYIVRSFYNDFENKRNRVEFNAEESAILAKAKKDIQFQIIKHANRSLKKQSAMPNFVEKNMKPLLDTFSELTDNIKEKMVNYAISTNRRNEKIILFYVDNHYAKYLTELAVSGIDIQERVIQIQEVPTPVKTFYNNCFEAFHRLRQRHDVILEQEIFLRLDHVNVLKRSKHPTDAFNLLANLGQLDTLLAKLLKSFNAKLLSADNEEKAKLAAERAHLNVAYSFVLFELARFNYKNKVGSLELCLEKLSYARDYLKNVKTDRAETLARDIEIQRQHFKGELTRSADIDRHVLADGSFITLDQEFSFQEGQS